MMKTLRQTAKPPRDPGNPARRRRAWHRLPLGRSLLDAECSRLAEILPDLFGYHLLQVGRLGDADLLSSSRIPHCVLLDGDVDSAMPHPSSIYGRADALPIASDSVDVVILPHTLEFESDPHQVLREVERVLIAEGSVVIVGFNPWSLWGLGRLVTQRRADPPWCGRFLSLPRIKDWLALLGFQVTDTRCYFFRPPLRSARLMRKLYFMERLGARGWPNFAGAYIVVARKRVVTLIPIKPRWQPQRGLVGARVARPTTGNVRHD